MSEETYGLRELAEWIKEFDIYGSLRDMKLGSSEMAPRPFLEIYVQQLEQKFGKEEVDKKYKKEGYIVPTLLDEILNEKGYFKNVP